MRLVIGGGSAPTRPSKRTRRPDVEPRGPVSSELPEPVADTGDPTGRCAPGLDDILAFERDFPHPAGKALAVWERFEISLEVYDLLLWQADPSNREEVRRRLRLVSPSDHNTHRCALCEDSGFVHPSMTASQRCPRCVEVTV